MRFLKLSILPLFLFSSFGYAEKLSFPLAIEKAKSFVVHIIIKDSIQNKSLSSGTGFLLEDKNGEVVLVTAFHVISDLKEGRSLHIETRSGKRIPFQGIKHLQISASVDLAVIKVKWVGKALKWGEVSNNEVYSLGFPSGQFRKVKGDNINQEGGSFYFTPAEHKDFSGISGGPMLNSKGEVFGVVTHGTRKAISIFSINSDHFIFGVPINILKQLLKTPDLSMEEPESLIKKEVMNLKRQAEQGDAAAQFLFGRYIQEEDKKEAERWISKAMDQGHIGAKAWMLEMELHKHMSAVANWKKEETEQLRKSLKKAKQGNVESQYYVGRIFLEGIEASYDRSEYIDYRQARKWLGKAARQGHLEAQRLLGFMFFRGLGMEKPNYSEALKWLTSAAEQDNPFAQYQLGILFLEEKEGWTRNYQEAYKWLTSASNQGETIAEFQRKWEETSDEDYEQRDKFLSLSDPYHVYAQYKLGTMYFEGVGLLQPNYREARNWFVLVDQQYELSHLRQSAQYHLGIMSLKGLGVNTDYKEAFQWFIKPATPSGRNKGHAESQYQLGVMFSEGLGMKPNSEEALKWFSKAAKQGHVKAAEAKKRLISGSVEGQIDKTHPESNSNCPPSFFSVKE